MSPSRERNGQGLRCAAQPPAGSATAAMRPRASIAVTTMVAALLPAAASPGAAGAHSYELKVVARAGQVNLTGMEREVSINDLGHVAFIGQLNNSGTGFEDVFLADGVGDPRRLSTFAGASRNFSISVQATNDGRVAARDQVSGAPPDSFVRIWGPDVNDNDVIARGGGDPFDDYDSVFARPSLNNNGQMVFTALDGAQNLLVTPATIGFNELALPAAVRPMIADTGRIVARSGGSGTSPIRIYSYALTQSTTLSGTMDGVGSMPGISDSGRMVVFHANPGSGPAVWLCYSQDGVNFSAPFRVTGLSGDGVLDPGENWIDGNSNGQVDPGEDTEGFTAFSVDTRVSVNSTHAELKSVTVCYQATRAGALGIFTSRVRIDLDAQPIMPVAEPPSKVAAVGDTFGAPGPSRMITDLNVADSVNNLGQVGFWAQTDQGPVVLRAKPLRNPIIVVPGIGATLNNDAYIDWLLNRARPMSTLRIEPLTRSYDDLIQTLVNVGYVQGDDLFICNYDWRMPPGPLDGQFDGHINGLAGQLTGPGRLYGVNYLGESLRAAAVARKQRFPDTPLEYVDIISHSTGGIVSRTYIQSDAYGEEFVEPGLGVLELPRVNYFFMLGVPNRGASLPWNALHDNWVAAAAYKHVLSKIVNGAYQKVLDGMMVTGPDGNIMAPVAPVDFVRRYVPTLRALLATYNFLDGGNVNSDAAVRNDGLLDLNAGLDLHDPPLGDPARFADLCTAIAMPGTLVDTKSTVVTRIGPAANVLAPFTDHFANNAAAGQVYFQDIVLPAGGDGTVPAESSYFQFLGDSRIEIRRFPGVQHTALPGNPAVQASILQTLEIVPDPGVISTGLGGEEIGEILAVISDPAETFVVDAQGRRLGWSAATGPVTEIPGSVWFGDADGIGWVIGPVPQPVELRITGLGADYYVQCTASQGGAEGGATSSGFLAAGEQISVPVEFPAGCPGPRGDANCDGLINFFDIDPFVLALFDLPAYQASFCSGATCAADVTCDGLVNFFDIDPLIECLFETCPDCP